MTAKEYLRSIRRLDENVESISLAMDTLRATLEGVQSPSLSGMPRGGGPVTMADGVARLVDLQRRWGIKVDRLVDKKELAEEQICELEEDHHVRVLRNYYLCNQTFEQIAVMEGKDWRTIHRWHGSALQEFEKKHQSFLQMGGKSNE